MAKKIITSIDEMDAALRKILGAQRYRHSQGVRYTAAALAMAHGADPAKAETAGILHDCAKYMSDENMLKTAKKLKLEITETESKNPSLLHAKVGACFAQRKYGITDPDILSSIRYHTTGKGGMNLLEKIIFIADYIEPGRFKADHLPEIRRMAFKDLDECIFMILHDTLEYLETSPKDIDKTTAEAYNFYKELHESNHSMEVNV